MCLQNPVLKHFCCWNFPNDTLNETRPVAPSRPASGFVALAGISSNLFRSAAGGSCITPRNTWLFSANLIWLVVLPCILDSHHVPHPAFPTERIPTLSPLNAQTGDGTTLESTPNVAPVRMKKWMHYFGPPFKTAVTSGDNQIHYIYIYKYK